jgi:beta-lactamase regulating signal transducer with metallopeptidase domain
MSRWFIDILNMSITASVVILFVIVIRFLLQKIQIPKIYSYVLWGVVLFRLLNPFSIESAISLIPVSTKSIPADITKSINPNVETGISIIDYNVNKTIQDSFSYVNPVYSINPIHTYLEIVSYVWLVGMILLFSYGIISYMRLKHKLTTATKFKDNIFETDRIQTPFVLGFIKPKIYLPIGLTVKEFEYIIKHEVTHIKRKDYIIKLIAYVALIIHWFNPFIWLSFYLMSKDMELSCDESVMKQTKNDIRMDYSTSLLAFSIRQSGLLSPLAFGESSVKTRVQNVLKYKKPSFWVSVLSLIVVVILGYTLITNTVRNDIPNVSVSSENGGIADTIRGTYSWDFGLEKVIADSISPKEFQYKENNIITVFKGEKLTVSTQNGNRKKLIPFTLESVECWNEELNEINLNMDSFIIENDRLNFNVPDQTGEYILYMQLRFKNGYVSYGLKINVLEEVPFKGIELSQIIETNLDIIESSPALSSRPGDYIREHQNEYDTILSYGDEALNYMLAKFETGETAGLREHLMMLLCKDILGEGNTITDQSLQPKEWYKQYIDSVKQANPNLEEQQKIILDNCKEFIENSDFTVKDIIDYDRVRFDFITRNQFDNVWTLQSEKRELLDENDWIVTIGDTILHDFVILVVDNETLECIGYIPIE